MASKKEKHESFVSNLSGGDQLEIHALYALIVLSFVISGTVRGVIGKFSLIIDFALVVAPCVLHVTVLSDHLFVCLFSGLILAFACSFCVRWGGRSPEFHHSFVDSKGRPVILSLFRGICLMSTSIFILAVDFPAFPRRFAKTETFGISLMDVGVGVFAFMMGLISPEARGLKSQIERNLVKTVLPLLVLGVARMLAVKTSDYQEHVSEYGTHWNFFITLALTKLVASILLLGFHGAFSDTLGSLSYAILCSFTQELSLHVYLSDWILQTPRTNFLTHNKEGVGSTLGYVAIFLWGTVIGQRIHAAFANEKPPTRRSLCARLFPWLLGGVLCGQILSHVLGPVSRRMADGAYIAWTVSNSCFMLCSILFGEILLSNGRNSSSKKPDRCASTVVENSIISLFNTFGMFHFLVSNLLTGITNIYFDTLTANDSAAVVVLILYQLVVLIAVFIYKNAPS